MITKQKILDIFRHKEILATSVRNGYVGPGVFDFEYDAVADKILALVPVKQKGKKEFTPPTLEEAIKFFAENGFNAELATRAWKGYNAAEPPWTDTGGKPIRSWKQKFINVWFSEQNKYYRLKSTLEEKHDSSMPKELF